MSKKKQNNKIKLSMTYSWVFSEKDWGESKEHWEKLKDDPKIVLGYDIINSWHSMNDIVYPELEEYKLEKLDSE